MSARDSESGSSTYKGGSGSAGGLGNGGIGGGMGGGGNYGGGGGGGGAGRNAGIGSRTGLATGNDWYGNTAFGRAGGNVQAYGTRDAQSLARAGMAPTVGSFGNFRTPTGQAMFAGSPVQGQSFYGRNMGQALSQAQRAQAAWQQAQSPASVPGLLAEPVPAAVMEAIPAYTPNPFYQGMPPPAQYSSFYKNRIAELLNAQRPPVDPRDYSNIYGGAGRAPLNISGVLGGGGIPGYNTSRDPNYRALGSGQTSINGVIGGFGSQGTPGAGSRRY